MKKRENYIFIKTLANLELWCIIMQLHRFVNLLPRCLPMLATVKCFWYNCLMFPQLLQQVTRLISLIANNTTDAPNYHCLRQVNTNDIIDFSFHSDYQRTPDCIFYLCHCLLIPQSLLLLIVYAHERRHSQGFPCSGSTLGKVMDWSNAIFPGLLNVNITKY